MSIISMPFKEVNFNEVSKPAPSGDIIIANPSTFASNIWSNKPHELSETQGQIFLRSKRIGDLDSFKYFDPWARDLANSRYLKLDPDFE